MRVIRLGRATSARQIRALTPLPEGLQGEVRAILEQVRSGGDEALRLLRARFDRVGSGAGPAGRSLGGEPTAEPPSPATAGEGAADPELRVSPARLEAAAEALEPEVMAAMERAMRNVRAVAEAQLAEGAVVSLGEGQEIAVVEVPVRRAAAYVPGGRAPYPSTLIMCATAARAAGVEELAVCTPPGPEGRPHQAVLAACFLCEVTEVYCVGGAHAIGALAYGTESIPAADVIVGPGSARVQEAKRQMAGTVGIDGLAGPTELVVVASPGADPELVALDLLAQAEHGADTLLALICADAELLGAAEQAAARLAARATSLPDARLVLVEALDTAAAVALAEHLAPEHLQLVGAEAEALAGDVRAAGCLFVGNEGGPAFGDYVAGSNHVLPTGGAARYASALSVATFRRRMARVTLPEGAAARLAPAGAALARAEGFPLHGESMERRA